MAERRIKEIAEASGKAAGAKVTVDYHLGYPVTINHDAETEFAAKVAGAISGEGKEDGRCCR